MKPDKDDKKANSFLNKNDVRYRGLSLLLLVDNNPNQFHLLLVEGYSTAFACQIKALRL